MDLKKKKVEALTQKLSLEKNIKFLGFLENHDDVYALMKSSKVLFSLQQEKALELCM